MVLTKPELDSRYCCFVELQGALGESEKLEVRTKMLQHAHSSTRELAYAFRLSLFL